MAAAAPAAPAAAPAVTPAVAPTPATPIVTPPVARAATQSGAGLQKATLRDVKIGGTLVQLGPDGEAAASYLLHEDYVDIGSREGTVILASDHYLSPRHARVFKEGAQWFVRDLESVNGVYRKVREPKLLVDGDLILLGQQVLRFEAVIDAEQGLRPAVQHGVHVFGAPARPRHARLSQRTVEGVVRDVFHLHRPETSLGRESADIVFTDDPFLSRRHAVFRYDVTTRRFFLEDLGSYNGTFVAIRGATPLEDGDMLRMGLHMFRIELTRKGSAGDAESVGQDPRGSTS